MGQKINKPIILFEGKYTKKDLDKLKKNNKIWKIIDIYENQLEELFEINNPLKTKQSEYIENKLIDQELVGNWIYFSWNGHLVHTVNEEEYFSLRTNRNKNLINKKEQDDLYGFCVGMVGLSVGGSIAAGLSYQGIAKDIKLAEFDTLETTNLNRVRAGISDVGTKKIDIVCRQVYEINPYANLYCFSEGLTKDNIKDFIYTDPKPKVIFEIIDDFQMKILLRLEARKAGIPVVMMANLGDNILIDIERYDLEPDLPLLNGLLGDLPEKILENPNEDRNKYAVQIVGIENVPTKALESVREIGKTLVGRPQLSSTVTIGGGLGVYLVRMVAMNRNLKSGRYKVKFDNLFSLSDNQGDERAI